MQPAAGTVHQVYAPANKAPEYDDEKPGDRYHDRHAFRRSKKARQHVLKQLLANPDSGEADGERSNGQNDGQDGKNINQAANSGEEAEGPRREVEREENSQMIQNGQPEGGREHPWIPRVRGESR